MGACAKERSLTLLANNSYCVIIEVIFNGSRTEISKSLKSVYFINNKFYVYCPLSDYEHKIISEPYANILWYFAYVT